MNNQKRIYRNVDDTTKAKIAQKMRNRGKSETHKQKISNAMKSYWATIPYRPDQTNNNDSKTSNHETN